MSVNNHFFNTVTSTTSTTFCTTISATRCRSTTICSFSIQCSATYKYRIIEQSLFQKFFLAYPTSNPFPQQRPQQSIYPQMPGNQQPTYNHTTVVVQPSPTYGGGGGGGYGGHHGCLGGSTLAGAGLGLAGGALLGGEILKRHIMKHCSNLF
jgi:hypothetical protein